MVLLLFLSKVWVAGHFNFGIQIEIQFIAAVLQSIFEVE